MFKQEPIGKDELASYNRKVKGVSIRARKIITSFQPYKCLARRENSLNNPLWIVHDMNRFDKHRELLLVVGGIGMTIPPIVQAEYWKLKEKSQPTDADAAEFDRCMHMYSKYSPQVCFREFRQGETNAVIPSLKELFDYVSGFIALFRDEV